MRLSDGRLGHTQVVSSRRFKEDIKPLDKTSQALYALKPVSFRLKKGMTPCSPWLWPDRGGGGTGGPCLVVRNDKGQVDSVRYEMVNAMLLNEFLKEHRKVEEQGRRNRKRRSAAKIYGAEKQDFEATVAQLTARLDEQAAQIQKVSAQLEVSKPAPQVVNNP